MLFVIVYKLTYRLGHTSSGSFRFRTQSTDGECRGDVGEAREFPDLAVPAVSGRGAIRIPLGSANFPRKRSLSGMEARLSAQRARQDLHSHFIHGATQRTPRRRSPPRIPAQAKGARACAVSAVCYRKKLTAVCPIPCPLAAIRSICHMFG